MLHARAHRLYPLTWHNSVALRWELVGCNSDEDDEDDGDNTDDDDSDENEDTGDKLSLNDDRHR